MAKGFAKVTRCIGFSYSDVEPMSNEPAGSTTSSGQSAQSRNVSPGLKLRWPSSVAGAVKAVCGAGWTTGGDTGAGAGAAGGAAGGGRVSGGRGRGGGRRRGSRRWSGSRRRSGSRRGRRRARCPEIKLLSQGRSHPRNLLVVGGAGHADARAVEDLFGGQIWGAQLLDELADKWTIGAGVVGDHLTGCNRVEGKRTLGCVQRGKPLRRWPEPALERISLGSIQNDYLYLCTFAVHVRR